jgi:hypothetical protein
MASMESVEIFLPTFEAFVYWYVFQVTIDPALALRLTSVTEKISLQWSAEPVSAFLVSSDMFVMNKQGFPVLTKEWQQVIQKHQQVGFYLSFGSF